MLYFVCDNCVEQNNYEMYAFFTPDGARDHEKLLHAGLSTSYTVKVLD